MGGGDRDGNGGGLSYRDAGVDIDAQDEALRRIKATVRGTATPGVLSELGSFGGLFAPDLGGVDSPVLVSSADGVGTKLRVAFATGIHDTVGRDLVNHCVNDILVQGARPLFFLDYIATGRLEPAVLASVVEGVARGCREAGCALLGGETAEMPGFYADGEYDVAGFIVGLVDRGALIDGSAIRPGDVLVGLPSSGLHTNGYSLARRIVFDVAGLGVDDPLPGVGRTAGEALLEEHRCYLPPFEGCLDRVRGLAHITGGGLTDNLPRVLPDGCSARIDRSSWEVPAIFEFLASRGRVEREEMFRTFNMGIGMVAVVAPEQVDEVVAHLETKGAGPRRIGEVEPGDGVVRYVD